MEDLSLILWRERELLETLALQARDRAAGPGQRQEPLARHRGPRGRDDPRLDPGDRAAARGRRRRGRGLASALASNPSLRALAEAVDEPWRSILLDHREAFVGYTREIAEIAATNRELLTAGQQAARDMFLGLTETSPTATPTTARAVVDDRRHRLLDQSI